MTDTTLWLKKALESRLNCASRFDDLLLQKQWKCLVHLPCVSTLINSTGAVFLKVIDLDLNQRVAGAVLPATVKGEKAPCHTTSLSLAKPLFAVIIYHGFAIMSRGELQVIHSLK